VCCVCVCVCVFVIVVVWFRFCGDGGGGVAGVFRECVVVLCLEMECFFVFLAVFCGDCVFLFCVL